MTIIYRVQDRDGRGPWRPGFSNKWVIHRPDHEDLLPSYLEMPHALDRRTPGYHVGVGCWELDQLRRWFIPDEFDTLLNHGFACVKFYAGVFLGSSETQCLFERRKPLAEHDGIVSLYGEEVYGPDPIARYVHLA